MDHIKQAHDLTDPAAHHGECRSGLRRRAAAFDLQECEGHRGQDDVVLPTVIRAPCKVVQAEFVVEFAILLLDRPAAAGQRDQVEERGRLWEMRR